MQFEEITTLTSQLEKSRKMLTKEIADSNEIMIACHKRIKEESAPRQKFEDSTNHLNEILNHIDKMIIIQHLEIEKEQLAEKLQAENEVVQDNIIQNFKIEK